MNNPAFRSVVRRASDLVTPRSEIAAGFKTQAENKMQRAAVYVEKAKLIRECLDACDSVRNITENPELKKAVLFSIGLSTKAQGHLSDRDIEEILAGFVSRLGSDLEDTKSDILYRYLLTAGDSLGGTMRNVAGASAQASFAEGVTRTLTAKGLPFNSKTSEKGKRQAIYWNDRIMLFDRRPRFVDKSIDVILLSGQCSDLDASDLIESRAGYIAVGELKGGIDPAGADEHWKTATKALERIRKAFKPRARPKLFFAGAAIEPNMAKEIYEDVLAGKLSFAANLTSQRQTSALVEWLVSL
jgi:hypothetical protein